MELVTFNSVKYISVHSNKSVTIKIRNRCVTAMNLLLKQENNHNV